MTSPRPGRSHRALVVVVASLALVVAACRGGESATSPGTSAAAATPAAPPVTFVPRVSVPPLDYPSQPEGVPWPTDEWPTGPIPSGVDAVAVQDAIDGAFGPSNPEQGPKFDGLVIISGGRLVAERYRPGFGGPDSIHQSWSMAKSFTAALAGILVREGKLDIYAPAAVAAWSDPADPRHGITADQLLRMASGLEWDENYVGPTADITAMLAGVGKDDMAAYAASKPLAVAPDSRVSYSTGTTNIVAGIIGDTVGRGDPYRAFLQNELLSPIGIDADRTHPGFDPSGTFIGGSHMDTTARDFARFGYLHLRGGTWDGHQILPTGWVDYIRTPTPSPVGLAGYGAQWWVVPEHPSEFYASGLVGQHILVAPELDLVAVLLSDRTDQLDYGLVEQLVSIFAGGRDR